MPGPGHLSSFIRNPEALDRDRLSRRPGTATRYSLLSDFLKDLRLYIGDLRNLVRLLAGLLEGRQVNLVDNDHPPLGRQLLLDLFFELVHDEPGGFHPGLFGFFVPDLLVRRGPRRAPAPTPARSARVEF